MSSPIMSSFMSRDDDAPKAARGARCSSCAEVDDCAWCASAQRCMTVSEVFAEDCSGTVFDPPCPTSFVGDNHVVGNLVVEADPVFGGGHLMTSGPAGR